MVGIDPDQVGIERSVVDLGQRQAVSDLWLAELLVVVLDDVGGI